LLGRATSLAEALPAIEAYRGLERSPDHHFVQRVVSIAQQDESVSAATLIEAIHALSEVEAPIMSDTTIQRMLAGLANKNGDFWSIRMVLSFLESQGFELTCRHLQVVLRALRTRGQTQLGVQIFTEFSERGVKMNPSVVIEALRCGLPGGAGVFESHGLALTQCSERDLTALMRHATDTLDLELVMHLLSEPTVYRASPQIFVLVFKSLLLTARKSSKNRDHVLDQTRLIAEKVMKNHGAEIQPNHTDLIFNIFSECFPEDGLAKVEAWAAESGVTLTADDSLSHRTIPRLRKREFLTVLDGL